VYDLHVQDVMLPNVKRWDNSKVKILFPAPVSNQILVVPLLDCIQEEDKLIWNGEKDGIYMVRSG
jgi:hypothetical protein